MNVVRLHVRSSETESLSHTVPRSVPGNKNKTSIQPENVTGDGMSSEMETHSSQQVDNK